MWANVGTSPSWPSPCPPTAWRPPLISHRTRAAPSTIHMSAAPLRSRVRACFSRPHRRYLTPRRSTGRGAPHHQKQQQQQQLCRPSHLLSPQPNPALHSAMPVGHQCSRRCPENCTSPAAPQPSTDSNTTAASSSSMAGETESIDFDSVSRRHLLPCPVLSLGDIALDAVVTCG